MENKTLPNQTPKETWSSIKDGSLFKNFFKKTTRAAMFWNAVAYIIFIVVACINIEGAGCLSLLASIFTVAAFFDDTFEKEPDTHFWPALGILFWFALLMFGIIGGLYLLYTITILPFNRWLNKPKKKPLTIHSDFDGVLSDYSKKTK